MILLPVSHQPQQRQADCLAACARMVLHYLQVPVDYQRLTRLLRLDAIGIPFRNLQHLESLGLEIRITEGDMLKLQKISLAEFELAWLEKDYLCAVVSLV
jgi:ABC-type bacteriocin/lantibiotic exporter with double-glycine peptidase domain